MMDEPTREKEDWEMTVKEVLEIKVIKCAVPDNAIVTIFDKNKPYDLSDLSDKLLNCKVKDWELEFNAILSIYLA